LAELADYQQDTPDDKSNTGNTADQFPYNSTACWYDMKKFFLAG